MHFTILKMIATSGFLTALERTGFVFGRVSAPDPAGELTALLHIPSWFKGALHLYGEGRVSKGNVRRYGRKRKGTRRGGSPAVT